MMMWRNIRMGKCHSRMLLVVRLSRFRWLVRWPRRSWIIPQEGSCAHISNASISRTLLWWPVHHQTRDGSVPFVKHHATSFVSTVSWLKYSTNTQVVTRLRLWSCTRTVHTKFKIRMKIQSMTKAISWNNRNQKIFRNLKLSILWRDKDKNRRNFNSWNFNKLKRKRKRLFNSLLKIKLSVFYQIPIDKSKCQK